jgi:hypothetical protein
MIKELEESIKIAEDFVEKEDWLKLLQEESDPSALESFLGPKFFVFLYNHQNRWIPAFAGHALQFLRI